MRKRRLPTYISLLDAEKEVTDIVPTTICFFFSHYDIYYFIEIKKNENNKTSYHNSQILETKTNLMNMNIINKVLVNH